MPKRLLPELTAIAVLQEQCYMCQAQPGRRCSPQGNHLARFAAALVHDRITVGEYDMAAWAAGKTVPPLAAVVPPGPCR